MPGFRRAFNVARSVYRTGRSAYRVGRKVVRAISARRTKVGRKSYRAGARTDSYSTQTHVIKVVEDLVFAFSNDAEGLASPFVPLNRVWTSTVMQTAYNTMYQEYRMVKCAVKATFVRCTTSGGSIFDHTLTAGAQAIGGPTVYYAWDPVVPYAYNSAASSALKDDRSTKWMQLLDNSYSGFRTSLACGDRLMWMDIDDAPATGNNIGQYWCPCLNAYANTAIGNATGQLVMQLECDMTVQFRGRKV